MTKMITYRCPLCMQAVPWLENHYQEKHKGQAIHLGYKREPQQSSSVFSIKKTKVNANANNANNANANAETETCTTQ